jgi:hypothetical protein
VERRARHVLARAAFGLRGAVQDRRLPHLRAPGHGRQQRPHRVLRPRCRRHSPAELDAVFRERTLTYDDGDSTYVVKLPTAWLTDDYRNVYSLLNPQLERTLVAIWQRQGCPDAPEGVG